MILFFALFVVVVVGFLVVVVVVEVVVVVVDVVDMAVVVEVVEADVSGEYTRMASFGFTVTVFECRRRVATVEEGTEVVVVVVVVVLGVLILLGRLVEEDTVEGDEAGVEAGAGLVVVTGAGVEVTVTRKVTMFTSLSLLPALVMMDEGSSEAITSGAASVVITDGGGGGGESQKSSTKGRAAGGDGLVVTAVSLFSDSDSRRLSLPLELRRSTR